jgi:hypothetical protein
MPSMRDVIHEAGHATIARHLNTRVITVTPTIVRTEYRRGPGVARIAAIIAMAGPMAEYRHAGMTSEDAARAWTTIWRTDLRHCIERLDAAGGGPVTPVRGEAERLVRRHWASIERVADALLERGRLSGAEVDALLGGAIGRR